MANAYASGKHSIAECDRCGQRYMLKELKKEIIKTRYGKFRAIKFKPMLIGGTIFKGGELMSVWVSDDSNHLSLSNPIYLQTGEII